MKDLQEYLVELAAFDPSSATEDERRKMIERGVELISSNVSVAPKTIEEIIAKRRQAVDTSAIEVPIHVKTGIDLQIENVNRILTLQEMTRERYIQAAGILVKGITSIISLVI